MNLASAILVASLFTLFVADNFAVCRIVAVILHYTYTAEFIWMSVFNLEIARALRQANTCLDGVIGWGLPLLVAVNALWWTRELKYRFIIEIRGYIFAVFVPVGASFL